MDANRLQDRIDWGLNRSAAALGQMTDAYRAKGGFHPLARSNRYLKLPAAFGRVDGNLNQPVGYGVAVWRGYFDASYTRVGDYLVQDRNTWFIAAQQCLLPILCVKTNRTISISRQPLPGTPILGSNSTQDPTICMISEWPASLLGIGTDGRFATRLPGDTAVTNMVALLPSTHEQILQPTDIVTDENGMAYIIVAAERSDLGWRLSVRGIST